MPSSSPFARVTVLGLGVLGAQIALQTAAHGVDVTAFDIDDAALTTGRGRLDAFAAEAAAQMPDAEAYRGAPGRIRLVSDLAEAVREADLVIEAVPERLELKRDVWARIGAAAPEATVFATNSSSLLPSAIADATGRPDRFLALHFANHVWVNNTAEVMGTPATDPEVADRVQAFAEAIGMVAIRLHKEQPGYVLNSLLIPFLGAAAELLVKGVADPATIDLTWRKATGAPAGPFQIYDVVGLRTAYAIASADPRAAVWAAYLKEHYLDQGKLGVESGEGFYRY
ncbi:3-hydroxyacyl-CoA dehydrogenase [Amnibacterium kyonggiense]|uniref:3-hydroxybutyryl-CoA dehydrogenase n=1 Tax=Amnibacterium kyonggiense TaxID=595671 RepID=A0A4R7FKB1_9MICO|nr:3-hydroxyacyl-CoA dehydrogenase [Amnibacterium kyonggiense]TDS76782.1 3-hydroxybutyryl-CoA dehydrogenase [Amnibacterium kyonggiense]